MKYIPALTIFALAFLPTPVKGTIFQIFYSQRRQKRECAAVLPTAGVANTDNCICGNDFFPPSGLFIDCSPLEENICVSPSDVRFCTNSSLKTTSSYSAYTTGRRFVSPFTSPKIDEEYVRIDIDKGNFRNRFSFQFLRDGGLPSPYSSCRISSDGYFESNDSGPGNFVDCARCVICESGFDFKYDCSNVNGTLAFNDVTNTTELIPGPKVESCFPITNIIPSF